MKGAIAQLVVRRADNAKVPGSKPGSTNLFSLKLILFILLKGEPNFKKFLFQSLIGSSVLLTHAHKPQMKAHTRTTKTAD